MDYYLFAFQSTHAAIATHKMLETEMPATIMPVLREISASCGIAVRIEPAHLERCLELMDPPQFDTTLYYVDGSSVTPIKTFTA